MLHKFCDWSDWRDWRATRNFISFQSITASEQTYLRYSVLERGNILLSSSTDITCGSKHWPPLTAGFYWDFAI